MSSKVSIWNSTNHVMSNWHSLFWVCYGIVISIPFLKPKPQTFLTSSLPPLQNSQTTDCLNKVGPADLKSNPLKEIKLKMSDWGTERTKKNLENRNHSTKNVKWACEQRRPFIAPPLQHLATSLCVLNGSVDDYSLPTIRRNATLKKLQVASSKFFLCLVCKISFLTLLSFGDPLLRIT